MRERVVLLRQALGQAVADGKLVRNPAADVRLPRAPRPEPRPLSHGELHGLADAAGGRDRLLLLVLGYGGLRWSEVVALRVGDVSDGGQRLRLRRAAVQVGGKTVVGPLKNYEARTVVLPNSVAFELGAWIDGFESTRLVFPSQTGGFLLSQNWRRDCLTPISRRLFGRVVTPHHLRDTAATLAIGAGASVTTVAKMLGHENASTTLRHYAGFFPDDLETVANALDVQARRYVGDDAG